MARSCQEGRRRDAYAQSKLTAQLTTCSVGKARVVPVTRGALDPSRPESEIELTVRGQTGVYTAQMIWSEEIALRVAREFFELNTLDSRLTCRSVSDWINQAH